MRTDSTNDTKRSRPFMDCLTLTYEDLAARCADLENVLRDYLIEAHVHSIDGLDECDHEAGVCFHAYHVALGRAVDILADPTLTRLVTARRHQCDAEAMPALRHG